MRSGRAATQLRASLHREKMADPDRPTWPQGSAAIVTHEDGTRWNTATASLAMRRGGSFVVCVEGMMKPVPCEQVAIGPHDPELLHFRKRPKPEDAPAVGPDGFKRGPDGRLELSGPDLARFEAIHGDVGEFKDWSRGTGFGRVP